MPSHALSLLFSSDILSNHHATVSSLLPTTRAYNLEFQDIVYQSLVSAFSSPTLPPPDYITNISDKFNGGAEVYRSLIKILPAFEPALSTCRAVDSIRNFKSHTSEIQDTSSLIRSIFEACYESPLPPLKLRQWLDITAPKSLFVVALDSRIPNAQRMLLSLAVETGDRILNDPKYHEWFYISFNLCSAALCIFHSDDIASEILIAYIDHLSRIPFMNRSISEALDMFNLDLVLGKTYSSARILIDAFGENSLLPAQLCVLRTALKKYKVVEGYDAATLIYKNRIAETRFEESKANYVQTTTYKTPKKVNSLVIDFTPYTDDRLQSHRKLMSTPRFGQAQTPYTNKKTKAALGPNRPRGATFQFQAQNKLFGFGSPFVVKRDWRQREEGEDEGDISGSCSEGNIEEEEDRGSVINNEVNEWEAVKLLSAPQADSSEYSHQSSMSSVESEHDTRRRNRGESGSGSIDADLSDDLAAIITHKPKSIKSVKPGRHQSRANKRRKVVPSSSSISDNESDDSEQEVQIKQNKPLHQEVSNFISSDTDDFDALTRPKEVRTLGNETQLAKPAQPAKVFVSAPKAAPPKDLQDSHKAPSFLVASPHMKSPLRKSQTKHSLSRHLSTSQPQPVAKPLGILSDRPTLSKRKSTLMDDTSQSHSNKPRKNQRTLSHIMNFDGASSNDDRGSDSNKVQNQQAQTRLKLNPPNPRIHKSNKGANDIAPPKPSKSIPQIQLVKELEGSSRNLFSQSLPQPTSLQTLHSKGYMQPKQTPPNVGLARRKSTLSDLTEHTVEVDPISKVARWVETSTYTKADAYIARVEQEGEKERESNSEEERLKEKQRKKSIYNNKQLYKRREQTKATKSEMEMEKRQTGLSMEPRERLKEQIREGRNENRRELGRKKQEEGQGQEADKTKTGDLEIAEKLYGHNHSRKSNLNHTTSSRRSLHSQNRNTSGPIDLSSDTEQTDFSASPSSSSSEEVIPPQDRLEMLRQKVMSKYKNKSSMLDATLSRFHSRASETKKRI